MDRKYSDPTIWDNSIDADDDPSGGDGGYDAKGNFITPRAMLELIELRAENESLRAKLAEAEKDAERYRLAKESVSRGNMDIAICRVTWTEDDAEYQILCEERADEAIDSAIAKQKESKE